MTQGELDHLRESCSFPSEIQIRLPEADETIASTRLGEVAFYEAAFQASLRLPIHPTIKRILHYYNICLAQLASNMWRSIVSTVELERFHKFAISLNEFKNLFCLFYNPNPDFGWLYFKVRPRKTLLEVTLTVSRGERRNFSSSQGTTRSSSKDYSRILGFQGS